MTDIWSKVLRFWPVILAAILVLMAGVETRYQVQQLMSKATVDASQWEFIRQNMVRIGAHQVEIEGMQVHMTPGAIQRWGQIQATVDEDHRLLSEHLRGHD